MDKKDNGVYKYMDCSTTHITKEDDKFLDALTDDLSPDLIVDKYPYGYWMLLMDDAHLEEVLHSTTISDNIKGILRKAKELDCIWIRLDADGFEHGDLPKYDW